MGTIDKCDGHYCQVWWALLTSVMGTIDKCDGHYCQLCVDASLTRRSLDNKTKVYQNRKLSNFVKYKFLNIESKSL